MSRFGNTGRLHGNVFLLYRRRDDSVIVIFERNVKNEIFENSAQPLLRYSTQKFKEYFTAWLQLGRLNVTSYLVRKRLSSRSAFVAKLVTLKAELN